LWDRIELVAGIWKQVWLSALLYMIMIKAAVNYFHRFKTYIYLKPEADSRPCETCASICIFEKL